MPQLPPLRDLTRNIALDRDRSNNITVFHGLESDNDVLSILEDGAIKPLRYRNEDGIPELEGPRSLNYDILRLEHCSSRKIDLREYLEENEDSILSYGRDSTVEYLSNDWDNMEDLGLLGEVDLDSVHGLGRHEAVSVTESEEEVRHYTGESSGGCFEINVPERGVAYDSGDISMRIPGYIHLAFVDTVYVPESTYSEIEQSLDNHIRVETY